MKKIVLAITALFALAFDLSAQRYINTSSIVLSRKYDFELSEMAYRILPMLSVNANNHPKGWVWERGRSSALKEKGKSADFYEINKINDVEEFDGDEIANVSTAWVEGVDGDGEGEFVIIPVKPLRDMENSIFRHDEQSVKYHIYYNVKNGYQQSEDLYYKNNRVKDAIIRIYAAAYSLGQNDAYLRWNPDCIYEQKITLPDEVGENPFYLNSESADLLIDIPEKYQRDNVQLFLRLEILSVYKGTKYSDTCICDMSAKILAVYLPLSEPIIYGE